MLAGLLIEQSEVEKHIGAAYPGADQRFVHSGGGGKLLAFLIAGRHIQHLVDLVLAEAALLLRCGGRGTGSLDAAQFVEQVAGGFALL